MIDHRVLTDEMLTVLVISAALKFAKVEISLISSNFQSLIIIYRIEIYCIDQKRGDSYDVAEKDRHLF